VMLISHDPEVLLSFCDRILVLYSGRIVEDGPAGETFTDPLHPYTRALLGCRPASDSVGVVPRRSFRTVPGEPGDVVTEGCVFEPRCCDRMIICPSQLPHYAHVGKNRRVACFKYVP
jgi:peptide/nickel transport system ATP-binding protein